MHLYRGLQNVCNSEAELIVVTEQWDHPYKEGSSLFRFHISVANIVQSSVLSRSKFNINVHHQAMHAQVNR